GLEKVDRGSIKVLGRDVANATDLSRIRGKVGFVFQGFNLFSHLTILQNVMLAPIRVLKLKRAEAERLALQLLSRVGIAEHAGKYPSQISGGQQQRAAIARTLALQPEIVLFDEPTSALDPEMTAEVLDVLRELAKSGLTMLVVTHEMGFAREVASRIVFFDQGKIVADDQPRAFFENSENPRLKLFLSRILKH
ncbi:MAG TPA: amino acid ABC transporter ATP-binding protein, partial [Oligoflexia bacterium]|nr:amino acid ABC transporter ATP-binding protein [Oligoflexia bacterium]